jgi:protein involved in polysaccharide export with SLBB domain
VAIEARIRRTVTILGQTQRPGVFEIPAHRRLTLVEAIGMSGGMTRIANDKKVMLKRGSEVQTVNIRDITSGKGSDISLRDGDVVTIPESMF